MNKAKGFTLIEVLICLAIVGILLAVAWPAITGKPATQFKSQQVQPANYRGNSNVSCKNGSLILTKEGDTTYMYDSYGSKISCP